VRHLNSFHDLGWWGFVLAIVALVLAYPLDVLAHLTTPVLRNWWAGRSEATLRRRILKLEQEIDSANVLPELTKFEDVALMGIKRLGLMIAMSVNFMIGVGLWIFWYVEKQHGREVPLFLVALLWVGIIMNYENYRVLMDPVSTYWKIASGFKRSERTATLERLKKKLEK
jgi:hypothetical protein